MAARERLSLEVPDGGGHLLANVVLFGRLLREVGLDVGPGQLIDAARALLCIDINRPDDFYHTLRCTLVTRQEDLLLFDLAFDLFWRRGLETRSLLAQADGQIRARRPREPVPALRRLRAGATEREEGHEDDQKAETVVERLYTYSAVEVLRKKNFEAFTPEEVEQARRLIARLRWRLAERPARRLVPARRGARLDLRRTVRHTLKYGCEPLELRRRDRKTKSRPLVILCDISGSMERYTRFFLHFMHSLQNGLENVEAFVFGTRLTRITHYLARRDIGEAMLEVARAVQDWSGGTRIGECLKTFNYEWARRVLGRGAIVIIISDGWDRGDVDLLRTEMARLQRSCYRLIWLNPLLGLPDYQPLTQGLQAALPFVDDFLPIHNIESLEALAEHLCRIEGRRPARRQRRLAEESIPGRSTDA